MIYILTTDTLYYLMISFNILFFINFLVLIKSYNLIEIIIALIGSVYIILLIYLLLILPLIIFDQYDYEYEEIVYTVYLIMLNLLAVISGYKIILLHKKNALFEKEESKSKEIKQSTKPLAKNSIQRGLFKHSNQATQVIEKFEENIIPSMATIKSKNNFQNNIKAEEHGFTIEGVNKNTSSILTKLNITSNIYTRNPKAQNEFKIINNINLLKNSLREEELNEICIYIDIFLTYNCDQHWKVNEIISENNLWGHFGILRSKNTHKNNASVLGISPKYFKVICEILEISPDNGSPLIESRKY